LSYEAAANNEMLLAKSVRLLVKNTNKGGGSPEAISQHPEALFPPETFHKASTF